MTDPITSPRPRGRPALAPDRARTRVIQVRATQAQAEAFDALLGPDWLRAAVDQAIREAALVKNPVRRRHS